jgi:hypothetical protein
MNIPAASRGVSLYDNFYPNAASCGELVRRISLSPLHIRYNLCNLRNLWINKFRMAQHLVVVHFAKKLGHAYPNITKMSCLKFPT